MGSPILRLPHNDSVRGRRVGIDYIREKYACLGRIGGVLAFGKGSGISEGEEGRVLAFVQPISTLILVASIKGGHVTVAGNDMDATIIATII